MPKKSLELTKFAENQFNLRIRGAYFGKIKAIPNQDQTEYAIIYTQEISAISGPPINKETYLGKTDSLSKLEKISEIHSKKIAKENNFYFRNKANLSAKRKPKKIVEKHGNYVPLSGPDDDVMIRVEDNYDNL